MKAGDRLLVALDVHDAAAAQKLVSGIGRRVGYKVGLELFHAGGPALVQQLTEEGHRVFLDLKYHDIPNTVRRTVRRATELGVWMLNVHALGGEEALRLAVEEAEKTAFRTGTRPPLVIAVTVLTHLKDDDLVRLGLDGTAESLSIGLARLARTAGAAGVVCSAHEVQAIKAECGDDFVTVTPGIRPAGTPLGDQERVMTPGQAVRVGADYLVVGRPITRAPEPSEAVRSILAEMEEAMHQ